MRFDITALASTVGMFWGAAILIVASANLIWPSYGRTFLDLAAITGTLYGLVDGAIAGAVFGWLYNLLARRRPGAA
jgi:hypothetical protein